LTWRTNPLNIIAILNHALEHDSRTREREDKVPIYVSFELTATEVTCVEDGELNEQ